MILILALQNLGPRAPLITFLGATRARPKQLHAHIIMCFAALLEHVIHSAGLRGNPHAVRRNIHQVAYRLSAVGYEQEEGPKACRLVGPQKHMGPLGPRRGPFKLLQNMLLTCSLSVLTAPPRAPAPT